MKHGKIIMNSEPSGMSKWAVAAFHSGIHLEGLRWTTTNSG